MPGCALSRRRTGGAHPAGETAGSGAWLARGAVAAGMAKEPAAPNRHSFQARKGEHIMKKLVLGSIFMLAFSTCALAQSLDGRSYRPDRDADIDMFLSNWKDSMPRHTHGSIVERAIFTQGDPMKPTRRGAVLKYVNRFVYAALEAKASTQPTTLEKEQEVLFILSGEGAIKWKNKSAELYSGIALLIPANLEFTLTSTGDEALTMYLINEPIPDGFRPNDDLLVRDENTTPIASTRGHWSHIVKYLFETKDGLGTMERILTVAHDPMTIGHPHSHEEGVEEASTAIKGTSIAFLGKQIRWQPPGTGYMIPPDGKTPHCNINTSEEQIKLFYFARYKDHEVRE